MIAKISQGRGFRGALNYILRADAEPEILGGSMAGKSARELAKEFGSTRRLREDIGAPCYHVSLSLPAGEKLSAQEWEEVAAGYLTKMGLDPLNHQHIVTRHRDGSYDHIHIVTSRIGLDGSVWKPFRDRIKSKDVCRLLEKEYHLTAVSNEKKQYRAQTTQKERRMSARTGREPEKVFVQKTMNEILTEGTSLSPQVFCSELEKHGIIAVPNIATTGKMNGFSFQYAGRSYTGSQIGYAWKHLEKFIDIKPEDISWMQARKSRLQEGTPSDAVRSIRNAVWEVGIQGIPFDTALEKQGWTLEGDRLKKDTIEYSLSSIVDTGMLQANLKTLEGFSKKTKAKAQAKSRELAKHYHAPRRKSFMSEMRTEDVICGLMMFPEVAVFLVVLSVLTETIRRMEKPRNEAEFKAHMKAIWEQSNTAVLEEVKRTQEGIKNAGIARRDKTNIVIVEEPRRELREEDGSRRPSVREVGETPHIAAFRGEGRDRGNEGSSGRITVEKTHLDSDGSTRIPGGDSPVVIEPVPARRESDNVQVNTIFGAVEEWASLAQDLSVLTTRGEKMAKAKTKSVLYKEQVWDRQHSALQAPLYRVTVRGRGAEDGKVINLCKHKDGTETVWTADEVKAQIPSLEYWNARGYDVYLTPIDEKFHHILIDDLTAAGVEHLKASGFSPCLVQVSSADNYQAILRVPKAETSSEEQSAGNVLLQKLNTLPDGCGGDRAISAPRHPFRMTGFNNKKPARNNVQTKIELLKPGAVCEKATSEMEAIREARAADRRRATEERNKIETKVRRQAIETIRDRTIQRPDGETDADKDFRFRWNKFHGLAKKNVREGIWQNVDDSAIDFRVCKEMIQTGYSEEDTAKALQRCSPGLFDRHRNPDDYVRRTVSAAMQEILREAPKNEPQIQGPFFGR